MFEKQKLSFYDLAKRLVSLITNVDVRTYYPCRGFFRVSIGKTKAAEIIKNRE